MPLGQERQRVVGEPGGCLRHRDPTLAQDIIAAMKDTGGGLDRDFRRPQRDRHRAGRAGWLPAPPWCWPPAAPTSSTSRSPRCEQAGAAAVHVREFDADDLASHGPLRRRRSSPSTGRSAPRCWPSASSATRPAPRRTPAHAAAIVHTDFVAQVSLLTVLANTMRAAGSGRDRRVLVGGRRAGAPRQLRLRLGQGRAGRFLQRPRRRTARVGRAAAAGAARLRDRSDDRGHDARAVLQHAGAGGRGDRRARWPGAAAPCGCRAILRPVFFGMRLLPQFVWRRMPR